MLKLACKCHTVRRLRYFAQVQNVLHHERPRPHHAWNGAHDEGKCAAAMMKVQTYFPQALDHDHSTCMTFPLSLLL